MRPVAVSTDGAAVLATVVESTGAFSFSLAADKIYTVR
jgi:hypothetical protein